MTIDKEVSVGAGTQSSPIAFTLDPGSGVPTYLQLVHQVEHGLRLGYLKRGDQLPRVREVVADLAINPNTVLKAYRDLESKGLTTGRPGQGTFIENTLDEVDLAGLRRLRKTLVAWLSDADSSGLDPDAVVALFSSTLRDFTGRDFTERRGHDAARGASRTKGGVA